MRSKIYCVLENIRDSSFFENTTMFAFLAMVGLQLSALILWIATTIDPANPGILVSTTMAASTLLWTAIGLYFAVVGVCIPCSDDDMGLCTRAIIISVLGAVLSGGGFIDPLLTSTAVWINAILWFVLLASAISVGV